MRLLYHWFCRIIGVGHVLEVMNLYVAMLLLIFGMSMVSSLDHVDGRKHRSPHRQGHHHHHRKHHKPRHALPVNEKLSVQWKRTSDSIPKNFNVTKNVSSTPWTLNQTSASLVFNSSLDDKEDITKLHKNINLENSSSTPNSSFTPIESTDLFVNSTTNFRKIPSKARTTIRLIEESTTQIFAESWSKSSQISDAGKMKNGIGSAASSVNFNITEIEEGQDEDLEKLFGSAENRGNFTDAVVETPVVQLIRKKRSARLEDDEGEAVDDGGGRKATLADFDGPAMSNDPEDRESANAVHVRVKRDGSELDDDRSALSSFDSNYLRNLEDSFALSALEVLAQGSHPSNRVKRETGRVEDDPDSSVNTARNQRDGESTAPEDDVKTGQVGLTKLPANPVSGDLDYVFNNRVNELGHLEKRRPSVDSNFLAKSVNPVSRNRVNDPEGSENYVRLDVGQGDDASNFAAGTEISTLVNLLAKDVDSAFRDRVNDVEQLADGESAVDLEQKRINYFENVSQTSSPPNLEANEVNSISRNRVNVAADLGDGPNTSDSNSDFTPESQTSTPDDPLLNNVNPVSGNRVYVESPSTTEYTLDSHQENYGNASAIRSRTSAPAETLPRDVNSVSANRVSDEATEGWGPEKNESETNRRDGATKDQSSVKDASATRSQRSPADNSILKDDNSISRYRLDDVYPEIVQDPENSSPMAQLVRTKRFGDSFVYPGAPDASYANEANNDETADDPYNEDNRIIDSMLSKVDYGGVDGREDGSARSESARPFSGEEIHAGKTGDETSIRGKRSSFAERHRKKTDGGRRGFERKKKRRRNRAKTHQSRRSKIKRVSRGLSDREYDLEKSRPNMKRDDVEVQSSGNDGVVMSSRGERRRRESEDEEGESFYSEPGETAGRVRRDVRGIPEADFDGVAKSRDKRNTALREVENSKSREADARQNRSEGITDKHLSKAQAAESVRDIRQLVMELLAKVDELHGYIVEGNGSEEQSKNSAGSGILSNTSNVDDAVDGSNLQQVTKSQSAESAAPKPAVTMTRPEACWKRPTSGSRESQQSKNNRPARNLRGQRCGKNVRRKRKSNRKWDRWTDWSSCSVTCGRGRQIRWRHCVRNCSTAETEMEEKACQLPACGPGKFLGIFG